MGNSRNGGYPVGTYTVACRRGRALEYTKKVYRQLSLVHCRSNQCTLNMQKAIEVWITLLLGSLAGRSGAISCTSELQSLSCLPVFTHNPASLQKCFCTSKCPDLQTLRDTCFSGQLQTDPCTVKSVEGLEMLMVSAL